MSSRALPGAARAMLLASRLFLVSLGFFACVALALGRLAASEAGRARALARAGLEESLRAVAAGGEGILGSPEDPVLLQRGALCVEVRRLDHARLRLVATARVGVAREQVESVIELAPRESVSSGRMGAGSQQPRIGEPPPPERGRAFSLFRLR